jgi:hypothetical protein
MPGHLQLEAGFEDFSSISETNNSPSSSKRKALEDELTAVKNQRAKINSTIAHRED